VTAGTGGPVIKATALTGVAGRALTGSVGITDTGSKSIAVGISGAPLGMMFAASGSTISVLWASPVTGSYQLKLVATNGNGASSTVTIPVTITAR
ncbi:MAG TPA: peptidase S53, partial [Duganella sp.]|nr:peptidase S53 [Duganella sp.]